MSKEATLSTVNGSSVEITSGKDVIVDDGIGGKAELTGGEPEALYEVLKNHFEDDDESVVNGKSTLSEITGSTVKIDSHSLKIDDGIGGKSILSYFESEAFYEVLKDHFEEDEEDTEKENHNTTDCVCGNEDCQSTEFPAPDGELPPSGISSDLSNLTEEDESEEGKVTAVDDDSEIKENLLNITTPSESGASDTTTWEAPEETDTKSLPREVVLYQEVDAEGASDEQMEMYRELATIVEGLFETIVQKNVSYGNSFLKSGELDAVFSDEGPFDSEEEASAYGLFTRNQDKSKRYYEQVFTGTEELVGEEVTEVTGDAAAYWILATWLHQHGFPEESDGIDELFGDLNTLRFEERR